MKPLKQLNLAMAYIEDNLSKEIDFQMVAQLACCSEYHFRRLFSFLSGMTLSEYIRQRRLSQAALELCNADVKIIDVAMKYGYSSPDAFTRAFQGFHGVTPREAKTIGTALKAIPPMTFQLTIKGGSKMDYRIVEKEAFYIVGIKRRITLIYRGVNPDVKAMYLSLSKEDFRKLAQLSNMELEGIVNASVNFEVDRFEGSSLDHFIGVATTIKPEGKWDVLSVPASTWAVFTVEGTFPEALQTTWAKIASEWLVPQVSGYELNEGPELLCYNKDEYLDSSNFRCEIWIPVVKK